MASFNFLVPKKIQQLREKIKKEGFRKVLKGMGWKVIAAVIVFYLIRDTVLYIIIPILIARGMFSGD